MEPFRFKQFHVRHDRSSVRIGVDSVTLGAWAEVASARHILDVGTGCGILALMCAQRNKIAEIRAIDVHSESVAQARANFLESPWSNRLHAEQIDFLDLGPFGPGYDLIISNPPYFHSGIKNINTPRQRARHQDSLSPSVLIKYSSGLLAPGGRLAMVVPCDQEHEIRESAIRGGLSLARLTRVKSREDLQSKRIMFEFRRVISDNSQFSEKELILEVSQGVPTEEYRHLCRDFYLNF